MRGLLHLAVCASSATVVLGQLDMGTHSIACRLLPVACALSPCASSRGACGPAGTCKCENGGVCLGKFGTLFEEDAPLTEESEQCLCAAGWRGYLCQEDQDECRCACTILQGPAPVLTSTALRLPLGLPHAFTGRVKTRSASRNIRASATAASADITVRSTTMTVPRSRASTGERASMAQTPTSASVAQASKEVRKPVPALHRDGRESVDKRACADACEEPRRLEPVLRDVRGAYGVDASRHVLLNPVSRANVGIGTPDSKLTFSHPDTTLPYILTRHPDAW